MLSTKDKVKILRIIESSLENFSSECVLLSNLIEFNKLDEETAVRTAIKLKSESDKIINIAKGDYEF